MVRSLGAVERELAVLVVKARQVQLCMGELVPLPSTGPSRVI